jgi:hypothetical protein
MFATLLIIELILPSFEPILLESFIGRFSEFSGG